MDIVKEKGRLRKQIRELKKYLSADNKQKEADEVFQQIESLDEFQSAKNILVYWSMPDELPTHLFINSWYREKTFYLPRIKGDELELRKYEGEHSLEEGLYKNIKEPKGQLMHSDALLDLIIVPGVAFDKERNRMGRGGGFYDRLFERFSDVLKVGVCLKCQMVEEVPVEPHDQKMNRVVTA